MNGLNSAGNLAYDYARFEEKDRTEIKAIAKAKKPKKKASIMKGVCYMVVAVVMLSMLIYTRAVQTELSKDYETTQADITRVKNENSRLEIKLQSKLSIENIEEISKEELGLTEVRSQQMEYVEFQDESKAEVVEQTSIWKNIVNWFKDLFR